MGWRSGMQFDRRRNFSVPMIARWWAFRQLDSLRAGAHWVGARGKLAQIAAVVTLCLFVAVALAAVLRLAIRRKN